MQNAEPTAPSVLVTGAKGFLGRAVIGQLLARGYSVTGTRRAPSSNAEPAFGESSHSSQIEWIETPNGLFAPNALAGRTFHSVVHLASFVPSSGGENRWENVRTIQSAMLDSTLSLLEAVAGKTTHLVLASSVTVYGKNLRGVIDETRVTEPTDPYGLFKLTSEGLFRLAAQQQGIPCALLRPTQLYGPGEPHGIFLQKFFLPAALKGQPIRLVKGGREVKDLLWIDDAAEGFAAAVAQRAEGVFNVSSGRGVSVRELAELVQQSAGSPPSLDLHDDDSVVPDQVFSAKKIAQSLGVYPQVSIEEGLNRLSLL